MNVLGMTDWQDISDKISTRRTPKQCRERWMNQLDPDLIRAPWTSDEDKLIVEMIDKCGTRWRQISKHLPGRSDAAVANRYHQHLKNQVMDTKLAKIQSNPHARSRQVVDPSVRSLFGRPSRRIGRRPSKAKKSGGQKAAPKKNLEAAAPKTATTELVETSSEGLQSHITGTEHSVSDTNSRSRLEPSTHQHSRIIANHRGRLEPDFRISRRFSHSSESSETVSDGLSDDDSGSFSLPVEYSSKAAQLNATRHAVSTSPSMTLEPLVLLLLASRVESPTSVSESTIATAGSRASFDSVNSGSSQQVTCVGKSPNSRNCDAAGNQATQEHSGVSNPPLCMPLSGGKLWHIC